MMRDLLDDSGLDRRIHRRLDTLLKIDAGQSMRSIAREFGVYDETIRHIKRKYLDEGLDGILRFTSKTNPEWATLYPKLLRLLKENPHYSYRELGNKMGVSRYVIFRMMKKLRIPKEHGNRGRTYATRRPKTATGSIGSLRQNGRTGENTHQPAEEGATKQAHRGQDYQRVG